MDILSENIEKNKDNMIKDVEKVVKIKSVEGVKKEGKPFGDGPAEALNCALDICKNIGFKTVNLDNYVGYAEYGTGKDYVAVLGHLDVVPAGDGWNTDPFSPEIIDGKMYGRGTCDDKGPIISALYGLKALADSKLKISKRVRVIFGTNEESGSKEISHYLEKEKDPVSGFTPDAEYPIIYGEKGITIIDVIKKVQVKPSGNIKINYIRGGEKANMVPNYCEAGLTVKDIESVKKLLNDFKSETGYDIRLEEKPDEIVLKSYGLGAHGSLPELGKNAVMQLFGFLSKLPCEKNDISDFVAFFDKYVGMETDGKSFGIELKDDVSGKLTNNVGVVRADENEIKLKLNVRYPVTFKYEDMMVPFKKRISEMGYEVNVILREDPLYFSKDNPLIKTLQKVYTEQTGKEAKLLAIGGGTYAKNMPNIVAFGPQLPGEPDLCHNANEYMKIEDLVLNAKIYAHAIYELAK